MFNEDRPKPIQYNTPSALNLFNICFFSWTPFEQDPLLYLFKIYALHLNFYQINTPVQQMDTVQHVQQKLKFVPRVSFVQQFFENVQHLFNTYTNNTFITPRQHIQHNT